MTRDFKGHFESSDPRNVVWGAGGCVWPTVPPYRMRLGSENAPEEWALLRTDGILFQATVAAQHDNVLWQAISPLPPFLDGAWIWRNFSRAAQDIRWTLFFNNPAVAQAWEITQVLDGPLRGNEDTILDDWEWIYPHEQPGTPLLLAQVYFDELWPPDGWPPWT